MKFLSTRFLAGLFLALLSCNNKENQIKPQVDAVEKFCIVIHGGAGTILKENMTDSLEAEYNRVLDLAVSKGYEILKNGGNSLDAVTQTIMILEDSPLFNAGKGAVFTNEGKNELDASIMDGKSKAAGAVASVTKVKNPITLARAIMEVSEHVMMVGPGAEKFAEQNGVELVDPNYFYTVKRWEGLEKAKDREKTELDHAAAMHYDPMIKDQKFGTVGCVALDKNGNIAAGTSTGGMTNKRYGRVGDAPIIGAGTYADNATCGVSATGWGEFFIRNVVAYDISAQMQYKKVSLAEAAKETIQKKVPEMGGDGGIIAIDKDGNIIMEFNTAGMYRASIDKSGIKTIAIYK
ncbi:isoaspartyl peptidase/L-asparaginase family protein [Flavobacterium sp. UBA6135]|uniref:isoaspartyl peptidase/L-asparaginase family protein n=1 Tax=Flavobacterium sp. UBA6135 TaxID=1946553 RepID=UPI0025BAA986|nr:isoaspartyl peptidase/L-asparaginase [Flavobacterium sp. UBA6135]